MKIVIFYRDFYQSGGVPGEIQQLTKALAETHTVFTWGQHEKSPAIEIKHEKAYRYTNILDLKHQFSNFCIAEKPDILIIVGFFMLDNLVTAAVGSNHCKKIILNPLGQLTSAVMKNKIFVQDPDVRKLEKTVHRSAFRVSRLFNGINPLLKKAFLNTVGKKMLSYCQAIAVFSDYELAEIRQWTKTEDKAVIHLLWGTSAMPNEQASENYYRDILGLQDEKANFVYWGRIDWQFKGIDRLLNAVLKCANQEGINKLPFRVFLIGPDYRGGAQKVQQFIEKHQLQTCVFLILPGSYPAGSKAPLRDATASICLSRWDGFPRALRESIQLQVPILVSKETHCSALVSSFQLGISLENADDSNKAAEALLFMANNYQQLKHTENFLQCAKTLSWKNIADTFIEASRDNEISLTPERLGCI